MVRSGCPWRYLPTDLPPWQTVYWYFQQWEQAGATEALLAELRIKARRQAGREDEPSAAIIDSQSVKGADTVGRDSRGYDAGKKVNGRKRFIITDTTGLLITVTVLAASWQDRDGAKTALLSAYLTTPIARVRHTGVHRLALPGPALVARADHRAVRLPAGRHHARTRHPRRPPRGPELDHQPLPLSPTEGCDA
ncbi:hypothetical protein E1294_48690 [Nonomuraea diastatica]|uniref:Uncharacterized protein n=1 Tax=Nonomuraea diastatica TaxID=1848329 RepID=A0A4R4VRL3_9ACTN|nr:hypothetical protein E1294_48690 [Nonomuraea diastatica]